VSPLLFADPVADGTSAAAADGGDRGRLRGLTQLALAGLHETNVEPGPTTEAEAVGCIARDCASACCDGIGGSTGPYSCRCCCCCCCACPSTAAEAVLGDVSRSSLRCGRGGNISNEKCADYADSDPNNKAGAAVVSSAPMAPPKSSLELAASLSLLVVVATTPAFEAEGERQSDSESEMMITSESESAT